MARYLISRKSSDGDDLSELKDALDRVIKAVPGARIVRVNRDTATADLEIPAGSFSEFKDVLGSDFSADPNPVLGY